MLKTIHKSPSDRLTGATSDALLALVGHLREVGYAFVTPTPATHARVLARGSGAGDLRDAFGWNRPFDGDILPPALLADLLACDLVRVDGSGLRSAVRVSTVQGDLFVHSAFPTDAQDAVFLGPDSYRFADLIARELAACPPGPAARLVDIGTGAGVGAVVAGRCCPDLDLIVTDINPRALAHARIALAAAGMTAEAALGDTLSPVAGALDVVLANPPYIVDAEERAYRHGGDMYGAAVAWAMAADATARLAPAGRFILYTGSPIIAGRDPLRDRLATLAEVRGCTLRYAEIDPDVFGEELDQPAYAEVDRIALVSAVMTRL